MKRLTTFTCLMLLAASGVFAQGSVSLDHIDGLADSGIIKSGQPIVFHMRLTNESGRDIAGSTNGFRIYSPDGAQWTPITFSPTGAVTKAMYDLGIFKNEFSLTGAGADTIGFGGASISGTGIPNGFDEVILTINTKVRDIYDGKTLCLDSAFYPPGGAWLWSMTTERPLIPIWNGPYCFSVQTAEPVDSTAGE